MVFKSSNPESHGHTPGMFRMIELLVTLNMGIDIVLLKNFLLSVNNIYNNEHVCLQNVVSLTLSHHDAFVSNCIFL